MNGIDRLTNIIKDKLKSGSTNSAASYGVMHGRNAVSVGGTTYPAVFAVDFYVYDGETVYVVLNETKTLAVVVGK